MAGDACHAISACGFKVDAVAVQRGWAGRDAGGAAAVNATCGVLPRDTMHPTDRLTGTPTE